MPRQPFRTSSPLEDKVRRLEDELYMARATIIGLARHPELVELLHHQVSCKTFEEVRDWEQRTTDSIIEIASRTETPAGRNWDAGPERQNSFTSSEL
jgi:hypothetical protein